MEMKNTPKLRFPGFTDPWEQRKLKSIANMIVAGGDIDKNKIKESGTYPVIANALSKDGIVGYYDDSYRIEAPAVTVTGRGDIGVAKARHQNFTPVVRLLSLTTAHDVDFVEYAINNLKIVSESTGVPQLTVPQLSNYKIHITSIIEERKIGLFISKLDNLITLHQRKLEHLKLKKKSLLQKLFPKEGKVYPELRFPGFTGPWEQCKLADVANIIMGQSPSSQNYTDNPNDDILVQGNADLIDGQVVPRLWTKEITKSIDEGNIIMTVRAPVGDVAKTAYKVVLGRGVAGIKGDEYIYQFLLKLKYNHYWRSLSSGSTFESINSNDIKNLIIDIPCDEERTKIGNLLRTTDSLINLYQRKLEHLKLLKKALLQQLFV